MFYSLNNYIMKLENIINIFNTTQGTTFIPIRKSESVSSFSPGVKRQSISLMSREFKDPIITFEEVSLLDITEQLEDLVLEFLFNYSKNYTKIACIDIAKIPKGMTLDDVAQSWVKLKGLIPIEIIDLNNGRTEV